MSKNQKKRPVNKSKIPEDESPEILLQHIGFDEWFRDKSKDLLSGEFTAARVVEVNKNNYKVSNGRDEIVAECSGKLLFSVESSLDYPTVGDWVLVQYFDNSLAIIHQLLPRRSVLKRKDPGKKVEFQLIAANIDYALIMQSADANFNVNRLERYLVMTNESGIEPIVVLSKTDLLSDPERTEILDRLKPYIDKYLFLPVSSETGEGIDALQQELRSAKTYCLLGSSGVGKTTLINKLFGKNLFDVNEVREKDQKGRHTTTRRQLICLESGSIFIDTPGMRELGMFAVNSGLEETFDEITSYASQCRYKDCTHIHEPGCAILEAVERGVISGDRYHNYLKIQKEAAFYHMSYVEKRQKDKEFGKMVKNYKKSTRKK